MKLTLSQGELMAIINDKYNLNLKFSDLIIETESAFGVVFENALRKTLSIYGSNMVVFPDKKIAAIKHLRESLANVDAGRKDNNGGIERGIGLAQAKIAVEQPEVSILHAHRFNEPKSTY
jgi:hypothetical protein